MNSLTALTVFAVLSGCCGNQTLREYPPPRVVTNTTVPNECAWVPVEHMPACGGDSAACGVLARHEYQPAGVPMLVNGEGEALLFQLAQVQVFQGGELARTFAPPADWPTVFPKTDGWWVLMDDGDGQAMDWADELGGRVLAAPDAALGESPSVDPAGCFHAVPPAPARMAQSFGSSSLVFIEEFVRSNAAGERSTMTAELSGGSTLDAQGATSLNGAACLFMSSREDVEGDECTSVSSRWEQTLFVQCDQDSFSLVREMDAMRVGIGDDALPYVWFRHQGLLLIARFSQSETIVQPVGPVLAAGSTSGASNFLTHVILAERVLESGVAQVIYRRGDDIVLSIIQPDGRTSTAALPAAMPEGGAVVGASFDTRGRVHLQLATGVPGAMEYVVVGAP